MKHIFILIGFGRKGKQIRGKGFVGTDSEN
jgi:hypothetical protein